MTDSNLSGYRIIQVETNQFRGKRYIRYAVAVPNTNMPAFMFDMEEEEFMSPYTEVVDIIKKMRDCLSQPIIDNTKVVESVDIENASVTTKEIVLKD